jgi:predicted metal-dependent HD superfamily phosphohydrolase
MLLLDRGRTEWICSNWSLLITLKTAAIYLDFFPEQAGVGKADNTHLHEDIHCLPHLGLTDDTLALAHRNPVEIGLYFHCFIHKTTPPVHFIKRV